jgi:hypothetical protein
MVLFNLFGLKLYTVSDKMKVNAFNKNFKGRSTIVRNENDHLGFIYGKWFFGYIKEDAGGERRGSKTTIYLFSTKVKQKELLTQEIKTDNEKKQILNCWVRSDLCYFGLNYCKREIPMLRDFNPRPKQEKILKQIKSIYDKNLKAVIVLSGEPGTGKSVIAQLLALQLDTSLCKHWNPTDPGDDLNSIYQKVNPTKEKPLIVLLDEFDCIISKFSKGFQLNKYIATQVKDKTSWNSLLDEIDNGFFPYLILLLTTNRKLEWFDIVDPSLIRKGRTDLKIKVET